MNKIDNITKQIIEENIGSLKKDNFVYDDINLSFSVQINLTNKCFQKCIGCRKYEWPKEELNYKKVIDTLREMKNANHKLTVVFSGGEPTCHKDFNMIIDFCKAYDIEFGVLTSAIFSEKFNYKKMIETANFISISLDGSTEFSYKKTRGVDQFNLMKNNVEKMIDYKNKINSKTRIRFNSTISTANYYMIHEIYLFAIKMNIDCNFFPIHTWKHMKINNKLIMKFLNNDMQDKQFDRKIIKIISDMNREKTKMCITHFIHAFIDSNGDVFFCCRMADDNGDYKKRNKKYVLGNINKEDFFKIYYSKKAMKLRKKILENPCEKVCNECDRYYDINKEFYEYIENKNKELFI